MAAAGFTGKLRYRYRQVPLSHGAVDRIPVLLVHVSKGSSATASFEGIVDSGASNCLFHGDIARALGISDLRTGKRSRTGGVVSGASMDLYAHEIRLHVGADNFLLTGFFSDQLPIACLLGRNGFFDKYIVTFDPTETNPGFELTRVHRI